MRLRPVLVATLVLTGFMVLPANAACPGSGARGTSPTFAAVNAEIDKAAAKRKVPPFVLKAIAWHESRWRQFYSDGRVVVSGSCALGVMQVLPNGWDPAKLASDYKYNVDAGAQMLAAKMSASSANVPSSIGPDERRVAENWYRATYRYNGSGSGAMRYADAVFAAVASPPSEIRPWVVPVGVVNPRNVVTGYTPTSGHGYVAGLDGTWRSTLGTFHHTVVRGDFLAAAGRTTVGKTLEGDQTTGAQFFARNLGWETWTSARVSLSTHPVGRTSRLRHPRWVSATRPVALYASTPTGAEGRFGFSVKAARLTSAAKITEAFVPVVDGSVSLRASASSTWTLNPPRNPTASITSAPAYVTDAATDSTAALKLAFADPAPGSGISYVEVARRAPGAAAYGTPLRVKVSSLRLTLPGAGGHDLRIRAIDNAGHVSPWSAPARVVVPRDDTDATLTFDGAWTSASVTGSWLGSLASAPSGASVSTPVKGTSYALIGTRGPGLAPLSVYLDDVLVTVVDTTADTTAQRQVLWQSALPEGDHVLRVVVGDAAAPEGFSAQDAATGYLDAIAVA